MKIAKSFALVPESTAGKSESRFIMIQTEKRPFFNIYYENNQKESQFWTYMSMCRCSLDAIYSGYGHGAGSDFTGEYFYDR